MVCWHVGERAARGLEARACWRESRRGGADRLAADVDWCRVNVQVVVGIRIIVVVVVVVVIAVPGTASGSLSVVTFAHVFSFFSSLLVAVVV